MNEATVDICKLLKLVALYPGKRGAPCVLPLARTLFGGSSSASAVAKESSCSVGPQLLRLPQPPSVRRHRISSTVAPQTEPVLRAPSGAQRSIL